MGWRFDAFKSGVVDGMKSWPYFAVFSLGMLGGAALTATLMTYFPASKDKEVIEQRSDFNQDMCKDISESYRNIISSQYESEKAANSIEENIRELSKTLDDMRTGYVGTPGLPGKTGIDKVFDGPGGSSFGNLFEGPGQDEEKKGEKKE